MRKTCAAHRFKRYCISLDFPETPPKLNSGSVKTSARRMPGVCLGTGLHAGPFTGCVRDFLSPTTQPVMSSLVTRPTQWHIEALSENAYMVMTYVAMAYIVMAHIAMAYIVIAYSSLTARPLQWRIEALSVN